MLNTAKAQDTAKASSLDEVVFSANKYPNKSTATGKVVTVVSREQLNLAGGKDLSQILNEQAGLYLNGANSNPGKDKTIFLRGAKGDHTLITIDGVPVYDATGIGSNFDIRLIPIDNIERIEILKGSQSTLYGSDAISGVINIITRKPLQKIFSGSGMLSHGSFKTWRASTTVAGKKGKIDYDFGYSYSGTGGIDETIDTTHSGQRDKDGYEQHSLQAGIGIQPLKKWHIKPYVRFSHLNADIDQGAFTDELDYISKIKNWQAGMRQEIIYANGKIVLLYNYNNNNREYTDDSVKSQNGPASYSKGEYSSQEHYAEAYISSALTGAIQITGGVDFRQSATDQKFMSASSFGTYLNELGKDSLRHNQLGLYGTANFKTEMGLNFEAGGRLNRHSEYGNKFVYNLNPSWFLKNRLKTFANLSSAFRTPSLYQLYSEYGNRDLKPESAVTFEAGLQYFDPSDKFNARFVYFRRHIKDVIYFYYDPATFQSIYINQDKQKDHGIELETSVHISKTTSIKLMLTYADGDITTKTNGKDTTYFNLFRRPRTVLGFDFQNQLNNRFYVSTHIRSTGKTVDEIGFPAKSITMENYLLWSIYAEYKFLKDRLKIFADLRNISNTEYSEVYGYNSPGFNAYGGLRFNF